jgi:hypothetical protein
MDDKEIFWKIIDPTIIEGKVKCECKCGTQRMVNLNNLKQGKSNSCGCIKNYRLFSVPLIEYHGYKKGDKINKLTLIDNPFRKKVPNGKNRMDNVIYLNCQCECGNKLEIKASDVVKSNTKSCGCTSLGQRNIGKVPRVFYRYLIKQAEVRNIEITITFEEIAELFDKQNGKCALSGVDLILPRIIRGNLRTASVDRIDPNKGYISGNIQWVHVNINYAKLAMGNEEFINLCKQVAEYNK